MSKDVPSRPALLRSAANIQWATPSAAGPLNAATFNWLLVLRLLRLLDFADNVKMVETIEIDAASFDFLQ